MNFVNGVFHLFYSSAAQHAVEGGVGRKDRSRRRRLGHDLETIGYAFSLDGYNFTKSLQNPVARREVRNGYTDYKVPFSSFFPF